jgi:cell division protein FtsB
MMAMTSSKRASSWRRASETLKRTFNTRRRKVLGAVALAALGAFITWQLGAVQAWLEVGNLKAASSLQQAEIASVQHEVATLGAFNKELSGKLANADEAKSRLCKMLLSYGSCRS